jgi:Na+-translocating ferredoxin:NAD+ oxidoreductase RNF subunit RnfB
MSWKLKGCGFAGALDMAGPLADGSRQINRAAAGG